MIKTLKLSGPDDPFFDDLDPIKERWMYESWLRDQEEELDKMRHHGILIGSFYNAEAAKHMLAGEKPTHRSTDAEVEETMAKIRSGKPEQPKSKHRRKRRIIRDN